MTSKKTDIETRIAATRAALEKYESAIVEIETILGLEPGELLTQWIETGLDGDGGSVCVVSGDLHPGDFCLHRQHFAKARKIQNILDRVLKAA